MNKKNAKALIKLIGCAAMLAGILWFLFYRLTHIDMTPLRAAVENPAPIILALAGWILAIFDK